MFFPHHEMVSGIRVRGQRRAGAKPGNEHVPSRKWFNYDVQFRKLCIYSTVIPSTFTGFPISGILYLPCLQGLTSHGLRVTCRSAWNSVVVRHFNGHGTLWLSSFWFCYGNCGKLWKSPIDRLFLMISLSKMVMSHSYVELPEGKSRYIHVFRHGSILPFPQHSHVAGYHKARYRKRGWSINKNILGPISRLFFLNPQYWEA